MPGATAARRPRSARSDRRRGAGHDGGDAGRRGVGAARPAGAPLRNAALTTLVRDVSKQDAAATFRRLDLRCLPPSACAARSLLHEAPKRGTRSSAAAATCQRARCRPGLVNLLGYAERGSVTRHAGRCSRPRRARRVRSVRRRGQAFRPARHSRQLRDDRRHRVRARGDPAQDQPTRRYVLAVRKPIDGDPGRRPAPSAPRS